MLLQQLTYNFIRFLADQIRCGMFVKISNSPLGVMDGKPVKCGQRFTFVLNVGVTSISIIATKANIIKRFNK